MADKLTKVPSDNSKIDYVEVSAGGIDTAWDALTIYDKPVLVEWNSSGKNWGLLYKYSGGQFGMGISQAYYSTTIHILSVINGEKTIKSVSGV